MKRPLYCCYFTQSAPPTLPTSRNDSRCVGQGIHPDRDGSSRPNASLTSASSASSITSRAACRTSSLRSIPSTLLSICAIRLRVASLAVTLLIGIPPAF